jgi:hypothetical protein
MIDYGKPLKIKLPKLTKVWNPFHHSIWMKIDKPVSRKEIAEAIKNQQFISPDTPKKMEDIWDASSREGHIQRIAWFVCNFSDKFPISIDFGIRGHCNLHVDDGNHRLAAAIFLRRKTITAVCGGEIAEIDRYLEDKNAKAIA